MTNIDVDYLKSLAGAHSEMLQDDPLSRDGEGVDEIIGGTIRGLRGKRFKKRKSIKGAASELAGQAVGRTVRAGVKAGVKGAKLAGRAAKAMMPGARKKRAMAKARRKATHVGGARKGTLRDIAKASKERRKGTAFAPGKSYQAASQEFDGPALVESALAKIRKKSLPQMPGEIVRGDLKEGRCRPLNESLRSKIAGVDNSRDWRGTAPD